MEHLGPASSVQIEADGSCRSAGLEGPAVAVADFAAVDTSFAVD